MFSSLIEKLFSGFNIGYDTKIVNWYDSNEKLLIIKKSKKFILLRPQSLFNIFFIFVICILNSILFFLSEWFPLYFKMWLVVAYLLNIIIWFIEIYNYLNVFSDNYQDRTVKTVNDWKIILEWWDKAFKKFYNQTIFVMIFYYLLMWVFLFSIYLYYNTLKTWWYFQIFINLTLFIIQSLQIKYLLWNFINLEMDFTIIDKKTIRNVDQLSINVNNLALDMEKIKSIKSYKDWFMWSIFNYWNIEILAEGDALWNADMLLKFIDKPDQIETYISDLKNS